MQSNETAHNCNCKPGGLSTGSGIAIAGGCLATALFVTGMGFVTGGNLIVLIVTSCFASLFAAALTDTVINANKATQADTQEQSAGGPGSSAKVADNTS